ncbi:MAG: LytR C-terminal domain-containing protein [Gordonia sp. (in: high G+C Gram-positive bacteria)]
MKADRENSRLPLRAGAMILFAIAVVFIFLGALSLKNSGSDPEGELKDAARSAQTSQPASTPTSAATTKAPAGSKSATTSEAADDGQVPDICVLNAGKVTGLAKEVGDTLQGAGFTLGTDPSNLATSSITENTIFYEAGQKAAAEKVAGSVPGGASAEERPAEFTKCPGELVVVVVNK